MNYYCTLHIVSKSNENLPNGLLNKSKKVRLHFTDNKSPERLAAFKRLKKKGILPKKNLERFHWTFDSDGKVKSSDLLDHIKWIISRLGKDFPLPRLREVGFDYWLQLYFEGNGSGGGPMITEEVSGLLLSNKVTLLIGFYYSEPE